MASRLTVSNALFKSTNTTYNRFFVVPGHVDGMREGEHASSVPWPFTSASHTVSWHADQAAPIYHPVSYAAILNHFAENAGNADAAIHVFV
jgi:hypothetical protein